jgi:hypothetical protein
MEFNSAFKGLRLIILLFLQKVEYVKLLRDEIHILTYTQDGEPHQKQRGVLKPGQTQLKYSTSLKQICVPKHFISDAKFPSNQFSNFILHTMQAKNETEFLE